MKRSHLGKPKNGRTVWKRSKRYRIALYASFTFTVVITNGIGEYMEKTHKQDDCYDVHGCVAHWGAAAEVVFNTRYDLTYDTICHEISHLVQCVMKHTGVGSDLTNQEPEAYITGYVGGAVFNQLKRWGVPIK